MKKKYLLLCLSLTINIYSQNATEKLNGSRTKTEKKENLFFSLKHRGSLCTIWTEKNSIDLFKDFKLKEILTYKTKEDINYSNLVVLDIRNGTNCKYIFNVIFRNGDIGWIKSSDIEYVPIEISWIISILNNNYYEENLHYYKKIKELYPNYTIPTSSKNNLINSKNKRKFGVAKLYFDCSSPVNEIIVNENEIFKNGNAVKKLILKERNTLRIELLKNNKLMVNNKPLDLKDLKKTVNDFLDNGGGIGLNLKLCDYCRGEKNPESSDHPNKSYIMIVNKNNFSNRDLQKIPGVYSEIREAFNHLILKQYNKLNNTSKEIYELDCETKDKLRKKYYPINIIYYTNQQNDNSSKVIRIVGNTEEIAEGIQEVNKVAEKKTFTTNSTIPFSIVEKIPTFFGCETFNDKIERKKCVNTKIQSFICDRFDNNILLNLGIKKRTRIYVALKINNKGNVEVIKIRAPHSELKKEVRKIIKQLPKFNAGSQNGIKVNVTHTLPINLN